MRPYIIKDRCNECKECIDLCPYDVFAAGDEGVEVADPRNCVECLACMDSCPAGAVTMGD